MVTTHIEFVSDLDGRVCPECSRHTVRETMLVNGYGLVLARATTCLRCGHERHRATHARYEARRGVPGARVPRIA